MVQEQESERHKSHRAPQEELSLKAFGSHLYLVPHLYVLVRTEINPKTQVWTPVQYGFQDKTREYGDLEQ